MAKVLNFLSTILLLFCFIPKVINFLQLLLEWGPVYKAGAKIKTKRKSDNISSGSLDRQYWKKL